MKDTTDALPFDPDDIGGWAVALYDENLCRPDLVRLIAWIRLERRPVALIYDSYNHEPKLAAIADAQAAGRLRPGDPFDLLPWSSPWRAPGRPPAASTPPLPPSPQPTTTAAALCCANPSSAP